MMDLAEAQRRLTELFRRNRGSAAVVGVLTAGDNGEIELSMSSEDDVEILRIGILGRRKAGAIVVERDLEDVTPTLERL